MIRRIISINEDKCSGCGVCAEACHEGAISMLNGKAHLMREDYCDGLGDCLPACPADAISFVEREALEYDAGAAAKNRDGKFVNSGKTLPCGCPGTESKTICRTESPSEAAHAPGRLSQWPVQIKLVPANAPYFDEAKLLVAADCTAFAYGSFHEDFIKGRVTLVGCPKLDGVDYSEKLTQIISENDIKSITVARMQVPCCGGIEHAVKMALERCGKMIPWQVVTIAPDGSIVDRT